MLSSVSSFQAIPHVAFAPGASLDKEQNQAEDTKQKDSKETIQSESSTVTKKAFEELSKQDQAKVQQLKKRDLEVKSHEQAHLSAAGSYATGGASFTYTTGPNGVRYATGGEVGIDTSKVEGNPEATIRKADAIRRAALAPASPSSQDQLVARNASAMSQTARVELIELKQKEQDSSKETGGTKEAKAIANSKTSKRQEENRIESSYTKDNASISNKGSLLDLTI